MTRRIRKAQRRLARDDRGIAMVTVMAMVMIISVLVAAILSRVLGEQRGVVRDRNVTTAREAAEAGLDEMVFKMGQDVSGVSNWSTFQTAYATTPYLGDVGDGKFAGTVAVNPANPAQLILTVKGTYGAGTRTLRAVVQQQSPPAFDYSMFASTKITIHHHNSWLSPDVLTTKIHSNGDITLDGPSQYKVQSISAVGSISFESSFAKLPDGSAVPTTGYNWTDPLPTPNLCFPGRTAGACTASSPKYKGYASITGDVFANSVVVNTRGQTLAGTAETTLTHQDLPATFGNVKAASVKLNGTTYTPANAATCTAANSCNKGDASGGAQLGGSITAVANYSPAVVPFPALNYQKTYKVRAAAESGTHIFTSPTTFLDYITTVSNGFYKKVDPTTGALSPWTSAADGAPGAIVIPGTWYLTSGNLSLSWSDILSRAKTKTGMSTISQAPIIVVQGSLINETGGITITTPLAVVGAGNRLDFVRPGPSIDIPTMIDSSALEPGVIAAGGTINADDCDTDSSWTSPSTYEPLKTCPIYVRGLVYSAGYDPVAKAATPTSQHWHNEDPKNLVKIFGAQVGDTLHDCSNFNFTYDPLVKKAFGFSGSGTVGIVDFRELGA